MKQKKIRDRRSGAATLQVKPTKHEELLYGQAEWLMGRPHPNLAPFSYTREANEPVLYYDITGCVDLKAYAKAPFGLQQYRGLLQAFAQIMEMCTTRDFPTSLLQLGIDSVFMSADGASRFVLVPLSGVPASKTATPAAFLQWLSVQGRKGNVSFADPSDARHAEALYDYAKRNPVFSLATFKEFLAAEFDAPGAGASAPRVASRAGQPSFGAAAAAWPAAGQRAVSGPMGAVPAAVAFDPVALLRNAPSASQVVASQGLADRVRDAVADVSPTAAPRTVVPQPAVSAGPQPPVAAPGKVAPQPASAAASGDLRPQPVVPAKPQPSPAAVSGEAPSQLTPASASGELQSTLTPASVSVELPSQSVSELKTTAPESQPQPAPVFAPAEDAPQVAASVPPAVSQSAPQAPAAQFAAPATPAPAQVPADAPAPASAPAAPASQTGFAPPRPSTPSQQFEPSGGTSLLGAAAVSRVGNSMASGFAPADCYLERVGDGSRYLVSGADPTVVGRGSASDVKLEGNTNISRTHVQVRRVGTSFEVVDLGSSNGTFVQGRRLSKGQAASVRLGEEFKLANEVLRFVESSPAGMR